MIKIYNEGKTYKSTKNYQVLGGYMYRNRVKKDRIIFEISALKSSQMTNE